MLISAQWSTVCVTLQITFKLRFTRLFFYGIIHVTKCEVIKSKMKEYQNNIKNIDIDKIDNEGNVSNIP